MPNPVEQRIKSHLKTLSRETGIPFNRLLKETFLQRFIVRIAHSVYRENLIFKGGLCLKQYLALDRGTKDLDFLLRQIQAEEATISSMFGEIAGIDMDDGFQFELSTVRLLDDSNKRYPGYRIVCAARCGTIKDAVQIDLSIDDIVDSRLARVLLLTTNNKPVFEKSSVELMVYPLEYIFSEKLQTIIFRAEFNSRMKDYYDIHKIILSEKLDIDRTRVAIFETFEYRKTAPKIIELDTKSLQKDWSRFLSKDKLSAPELTATIDDINQFLLTHNIVE